MVEAVCPYEPGERRHPDLRGSPGIGCRRVLFPRSWEHCKEQATVRASKSAPDPVPIVLLARLAVDQREQRQGLGPALLKDALQRAYAGAEIIGGRAILVHAIDPEAAMFYRKYGFESCPGLELHLMLLMKDVRASLGL